MSAWKSFQRLVSKLVGVLVVMSVEELVLSLMSLSEYPLESLLGGVSVSWMVLVLLVSPVLLVLLLVNDLEGRCNRWWGAVRHIHC